MLKFIQGLLGPPRHPQTSALSVKETRLNALETAFQAATLLQMRTKETDTAELFAENKESALAKMKCPPTYVKALHGDYNDTVHYWTDMITDKESLDSFITFRSEGANLAINRVWKIGNSGAARMMQIYPH